MMESRLPDGYTMRPATIDDAQAVAEVIVACQLADGDPPTMTVEELLVDWRSIDLANETFVVLGSNGQVVANADILNRRYVLVGVYGYVHPEHRNRGIGTTLVHWGEHWAYAHLSHAPAHARVLTEHFLRSSNAGARQLLEALGYTFVRKHYVMAIRLDRQPPPPLWPEGISVRSFVPGQDEQTVFIVGEEAFRDIWGRPPGTIERWLQPTRSPDFDPSLWFLLEDRRTGEVAGLCLCQIVAGKGSVEIVGVRRPWRRQGVALAGLHHAFGDLFRRGVREAELSVDAESTTGAPRVYGRAGMHVAQSYVRYQKELRPGEDLSTQATNL